MVDKLTLDTSLLLEYWKLQERRHITEALLALADAGEVKLAISARIHEDIPRDPLAQRIAELPMLHVEETPSIKRLGHWRLGRDVFPDSQFSDYHEAAQQLAKKAGAKDGEPNWKDWDHLQMHYLLKSTVFLTWETSILLIRDDLGARFGLRVQRPEEYLIERGKQA